MSCVFLLGGGGGGVRAMPIYVVFGGLGDGFIYHERGTPVDLRQKSRQPIELFDCGCKDVDGSHLELLGRMCGLSHKLHA